MEQTQIKSNFITVLSWLLIVFNGFGLLMAVMQNIMVHIMFDRDEFKQVPNSPDGFPSFILSNFNFFILLIGLLIMYSFISSIGLLKRRNWARISYIVLFGVGIIYMTTMMVFQWILSQNFNSEFKSSNDEFETMFIIMRIFMLVFTIGMSGLFGWLIKKLLSKSIKNEFHR